jgi:MOSC domain-containing protein YiiM
VSAGRVVSVNVSNGGIPKLPVPQARITAAGLEGDRQRDLRYHGGPDRAVCLYSTEHIGALRAEGHPIAAGTIGENLTLSGVPWEQMVPGARLQVGEALLEMTKYAHPCVNIAGSFQRGEITRVSQKLHPGWGRLYARVLRPGTVRPGDEARLVPAEPA